MTRHDGQHYRVWPWVLTIFLGLLTTAGGGADSAILGAAIMGGAIVMIIRAVRCNRAARHALAAAAADQAGKPGRRQAPASRSRRPGAGRRAARKAMTFLP